MRKLIAVMAPGILLCLLGVAALGKPDDPNRKTTMAVTLNRRAIARSRGVNEAWESQEQENQIFE
jgi:hypothetical protein